MNKVVLDNHEVDFDACVMLMDDAIREELHNKLAPNCNDQEFLDLYCQKHFEKFNQGFEI